MKLCVLRLQMPLLTMEHRYSTTNSMKRHYPFLLLVLSLPLVADEGNFEFATALCQPGQICIVREPQVNGYWKTRGALSELPKYNPASEQLWQVDLRSRDISKCKLEGRTNDLVQADFDSATKWPERHPSDFSPEKIMELGKNPGLRVHELHHQEIDGRGVGIGIIDQPLLVSHVEYKDRLKLYEEIHSEKNAPAVMHGPAVASIAAGKNVGVAPAALLYYIAEMHTTPPKKNGKWEFDLDSVTKSIDRLIEINKLLPSDKKMRVISLSLGINSKMNGYKAVKEAIERARENNIYVVYVGSDPFSGSDRLTNADPDKFESVRRGKFWGMHDYDNNKILIPMDSRTTAAPTGNNDYAYYSNGGLSWAVPYVAGLYALTCQVYPDITPELFWKVAFETSVTTKVEGEKYSELGKITNPAGLIAAVKTRSKKSTGLLAPQHPPTSKLSEQSHN
ncbi:MAG: S8/S53 family peptidase [Deltaproteobacteria bacterium]|nr:S8/S53 family peptidase [Deltaproteobacteria bacterium]